jgi:hypothetical protein
MNQSTAACANTAPCGETNLQVFIIRRNRLTVAERAEMLALHSRYFDNVQPARFYADLDGKDWVITLRGGARLAGFSTQKTMTLKHLGKEQRFLFSGDTIVDRAYWQEQRLAGCFGHLMLRLMGTHGEDELYWFLISKGYRTYRFLPVFFREFFPRPETTPAKLAAALDLVALAKFGTAYDGHSGLIVPDAQADRLRPEFCGVPESKRADPFVDYFLKRNPRFHEGYELACIAEIRRANLNRLAWRVIGQTSPVWIE